MNKKLLKFLLCVISASAAFIPLTLHAETFPSRPITIIVPFTAGGATDVLTRSIAEGMTKELGQSVIVTNLPGAGGSIGQARAARSSADGYTMLLGNVGTLAANASLYTQLPYDILEDFTPVASVGDAPQVLTVRGDLPVSNFEDFIKYAKAHGKEMNSGTAGVGSGSFLGDIVLKTELGLKIEPVHYRGASQAITDVMGGIIDYTIESSSTAVGTSSSGKAKPLVIMSSERVSVLPEVPSAAESSHPNLRYSIWNMMLVPKGVPQHVLDKLNAAVNHVLQRPDVRKRYAEMGLSVPSEESRSLEGASTLLKSEVAKWNELLKKAGVPPQSSR
ncbi:hypothetical protein CAP48_02275 [Advenella sp. S44]|uniref:Bug family tripartite tricarboxylate transporter substrate binding protein n=1 Tax=Advenella sp. S44 TaxID=1982755 RepID=UPI000C2A0BDC|nr:tripartite tricarboxylate transporter substrate binding protein [Advenella sp. S44]PJX28029.1 hypothetical protein CAP48_02275 [Advenella sp. S44]